MRIALVADFYPPVPGGLESHVARLASYLHDQGHSVIIITAKGGPDPKGRWTVVECPPNLAGLPGFHQDPEKPFLPPWEDRAFSRQLRLSVEQFRPDVLHCHGWCAASGIAVGHQSKIPVVITLHDYGLLCPMRTLYRAGSVCDHTAGLGCINCPGSGQSAPKRIGLAAGISLSRRAAARVENPTYIAVSSAVAERHIRAGIADDMLVIPNFIDAPTHSSTVPPPGGPALFLGPASAPKGLAVLEEAHRMLLSDGGHIVLHHVGGEVVEKSETVVRSGRLEGAAVSRAYEDARVVVVPSTWEEPCPTVALEAMTHARPVIASAVGGLPDIVSEGVTGMLVPPSDPRALATALRTLIDDTSLVDRMGAESRNDVSRFTTDHVAPLIVEAYDTAIGRFQAGLSS